MTQCANPEALVRRIIQQALDERLPDFSSGTGNQDAVLLGSRVAVAARLGFLGMHGHVFPVPLPRQAAETANLNYSVAADTSAEAQSEFNRLYSGIIAAFRQVETKL